MNLERLTSIFLGSLITLLLIVIVSHVSATYQVKLDLIVGTIGTVVGGLSLGFGAYFALLAVHAFAHLQTIRSAEEKANATLVEIQQRHGEYNAVQKQTSQLARSIYEAGDRIYVSLSQLLSSIPIGPTAEDRDRHQKLADKLIIERARFIVLNPGHSADDLHTHMLTLGDKGVEADAQVLDGIASDAAKDKQTRDQARVLAEIVRKRSKDSHPRS